MYYPFKLKTVFTSLLIIFAIYCLFLIWSRESVNTLVDTYNSRESIVTQDRNGDLISMQLNSDEFYADYIDHIPDLFQTLLLQKEDSYFYLHNGVNPVSIIQAIYGRFQKNGRRASSTLTQQLAKILLDHEQDRTFKNKIIEIFYSLALEKNLSKNEILLMYINSIYLGNQVQGINMASKLYFDVSPDNLIESQVLQLLATISSPSTKNPFLDANLAATKNIQNKLKSYLIKPNNKIILPTDNQIKKLKKKFKKNVVTDNAFELSAFSHCLQSCKVTLDSNLNNRIREIVNNRLLKLSGTHADNAAVVVIKEPEHELIGIIGSLDPSSLKAGNQINMAVRDRPIGSTVKPFLYVNGFKKGLRPYSILDDREYKYITGGGFAHYPKNYDYKYRGLVTLHESLSNSLNVPAVKVLEYIGLDNFYKFIINDLKIQPIQDLDKYQYGIALGQFEMDLLELTHLFSIFTNHGQIKPLIFSKDNSQLIKNETLNYEGKVIEDKYIQLVNKILIDRDMAVDQFGLIGNLRVDDKQVAVKTGTSSQYRDSWTIGYTPDYIVGVWVGNVDNTPMEDITGQKGAGGIWNDVIRLLIESEYENNTKFNFEKVINVDEKGNISYGLKNDKFSEHRNLLLDNQLIYSPHNKDNLLYEDGIVIQLEAANKVFWYINGEILNEVENKYESFYPTNSGEYIITAKTIDNKIEKITINIVDN